MTERFEIPAPYDKKFSVTITVTTDGMFTCTLPEEISALFEGKIELRKNKNGRFGYFQSDTLAGLKRYIEGKITDLCSEEIVKTERVIQFSIETACSYCIAADGSFVPWRISGACDWKDGTAHTDATHRTPFGLSIYAMPVDKVTYRFKSNRQERVEYKSCKKHALGITSEELEKDPCQWLCSIVGNIPAGSLQEMPYTDEAARLFVNLYKSLFTVNEKIKPFLSPEGVKQLAKNNGKLLS